MKIGPIGAELFHVDGWTCGHDEAYSETEWPSDSKERIDKFRIPPHVVRCLPFGFLKNMSAVQLFLEYMEHKFRNDKCTVQCGVSLQL
jgi:hypothetical protein